MANVTPLPQLDLDRAIHAPEGGEVGPVQSGWKLALREFAQNRLAVIGVAILVFFVLFCFAGPLVYHGQVLNTNLSATDLPPGPGHPLGTTEVGFVAAVIGITIGALWGAIAGLAGGIVDSVMMRVVDVFLSIPFLFIVLI